MRHCDKVGVEVAEGVHLVILAGVVHCINDLTATQNTSLESRNIAGTTDVECGMTAGVIHSINGLIVIHNMTVTGRVWNDCWGDTQHP